MFAAFMAMIVMLLWSESECKIFRGQIVGPRKVISKEIWSGEPTILKRELNLLDMLRTPLMLSFNRNIAFIPQGERREKNYMRRLLELRGLRSVKRLRNREQNQ
ncbi:unnamed protein product [Strongylus vulgaris]|uniref:Uncharacterized protein n=1 Tax=Strongylus vulgaris TaxID=40348 RepID=A0A3P7IJL0_STRVU|nr:unnamed protein product [Strongylus vulgaris]